jgi:hypothetical protein
MAWQAGSLDQGIWDFLNTSAGSPLLVTAFFPTSGYEGQVGRLLQRIQTGCGPDSLMAAEES